MEAADAPPEGETITTVLHPGWNAVGWLGPEAPVSDLFEQIEAARVVAMQDAREYRYAWPNRAEGFPPLTPGMGLWLYIGGDTPVRWTRPAAPDGLVLRLRPGLNLGGIVADGAVTPPAGTEAHAWRWDPVGQEYEPYRIGDTSLRQGDALWIEAAAPLNLWQPGTAAPPIVFLGDVPEYRRQGLLAEHEKVRRFFAEEFGVAIRGNIHYIAADVEAIRPLYRELVGREPQEGFCGRSVQGIRLVVVRCIGPPEGTLDYDYVSQLLIEVPGKGVSWRGAPTLDPRGPGWLVAGARQYALEEYRGGPTTRQRLNLETGAKRSWLPLSYFEVTENRDGETNFSERALGFFAVEWLAQRAGNASVFDYFKLMRTADDWRAAFETAFGLPVEDFYTQFAVYRDVRFLPLPHLTDEVVRPVVVFLDDVPTDTRAAIQNTTDGFYTILTERFGAAPFEYTLFVGADYESIGDAYMRLSGTWPGPGKSCDFRHLNTVMVTTLHCYEVFPDSLIRWSLDVALAQLAPVHALPPAGDDYSRRGPMWLQVGTERYTRDAYLAVASEGVRSRFETDLAFAVAPVRQHLSSMETISALNAAPNQVEASGFLAVEWLANHAGDPAVFEYYRVLPSSTSREAAFESAFGLTLGDFYEQFEAYHATLRR